MCRPIGAGLAADGATATALGLIGRASGAGGGVAVGPGENVLRLIPPLTITDADFERGLDIIVAAIAATV